MPAGKGKKKGKKTKLTKAEKERLKKEEAERKAQEEEEAKLRAEQEAKEREEREKQELEERRKLEEQERARHQAEIDELNEMIQGNAEKLFNLKNQRRTQEKWDRYMLCDGRPDPTCKRELNTYMNLWKEDNEFKEFQIVLQECELTLELVAELKNCLALDEDLTEEEMASHKESINELYALLESKIDEATMWLLKNPGENINKETENLESVIKSKNFKACIWGNTAKNPRVKNVDFLTEGFMVEIPKSLVLADVAIRLLYRNYDTMSSRCSTFSPKIKKIKEPQPAEKVEKVEEEKKEKVMEPDPPIDKTPDAPSQAPDPPREKSSSRKSRKSASRMSATSAKGSTIEKKEEDPKVADVPEIVDDKSNDQELKIIDYDDYDDLIDENVVDLRSFSPMGATAFIELLELPPQQQKVNNWLMQQVVSSELKRLNFFATNATPAAKSLNESQYLEHESRPNGSAKSNNSAPGTPNVSNIKPIAITLRVPDDVIFFEPPQLARWDEPSCHWKLDGFEDVVYEEESRTISFKTAHFGPITMVQDLYLNMPFQSWELRPVGVDNCILSVIAVNIDVDIEIKESRCCLRKPDDNEALTDLLGVWMEPATLIQRIKTAGINIFPAQDGDKYVSICKKDPVFVNSVYEQLALSSSSYAYCWSKWNGVEECPEDTVVIGAVEWCKEDQPTEDDYSLYMASTRICYKLAIGEFDENYSNEIAENTQMHPDLFHMVQDGCNELAKQRIADTSFQHVDCVYQLIKATNFLVYS